MAVIRVACLAAFLAGLFGLTTQPASAAGAEKLKFEVFKDKKGMFRWRLMEEDGSILATGGQGYKALADAKRGVELIKKAGTDKKMKFEIYEDAKKENRWRLKAANGQVVASSPAAFKAKSDAEKAIATIKEGAPKAEVVEVKD